MSSTDLTRLKELFREEFQQSLDISSDSNFSLDDIFSESFMEENCQLKDFDEFLGESPASIDDNPLEGSGAKFEDFVREKTEFGSWQAMRQKAEIEWMQRQVN